VVAKQRRIIHSISLFDITAVQLFEIHANVPHSKIFAVKSFSGVVVCLRYGYGGNEYAYYLNDSELQEFEALVKEKQVKVKRSNSNDYES
jgi:hypothetical protein